ncbi:MAG: hypothetical protein C4323_00505 [Mastigocladus sp. ERB_26_2]
MQKPEKGQGKKVFKNFFPLAFKLFPSVAKVPFATGLLQFLRSKTKIGEIMFPLFPDSSLTVA